MFTIRHNWKNKEYSSIDEVKAALSELKLQHVTLLWRSAKTGMQRLAFISVDSQGIAYQSYGDQSKFDFSVALKEATPE